VQELTSESVRRIFRAGQLWSSNVFGAALAGGLGGVLMLVVMGIVVSGNPTPNNILFATGLAVVLVLSAICFLPGNWIAAFPYAVAVEEGRGLELYAPLKRLYIPIEDVRDIRKSFLQQGYVIRLRRRHRLLTSFVIPWWFFGDQAEPLAKAIQEEIQRRAS